MPDCAPVGTGSVLRLGSVCSGIGGAELAFSGLATPAFASEVAAFPRAVLAHRFPEVPCHGDFTTIEAGTYGPVDVLAGGTPCQSFSVAGLRGGLADDRGNLALEYLRLADRLRPRWLLWENVPGVLSSDSGRDFGSFLGGMAELGYGFAYRVLDAQYFGLAQRRKRVFVVGHLGDWRRAAAVLLEPASLRRHPAPSREAGAHAAGTLAGVSPGGGWRCGGDEAASGQLIAAECAPSLSASNPYGDHESREGLLIADTLTVGANQTTGFIGEAVLAFGGNDTRGSIDIAPALNAHGGPHGRLDFESEALIAHRLRTEGFDASEDGAGRGTPTISVYQCHGGSVGPLGTLRASKSVGDGVPFVPTAFDTTQITSAQNWSDPKPGDPCHPLAATAHPPAIAGQGVRRLTPRECERLQGFPDDWTLIPWRGGTAPDGPRYKAIGNAWAVPVVRWIARRIAAEHARLPDVTDGLPIVQTRPAIGQTIGDGAREGGPV